MSTANKNLQGDILVRDFRITYLVPVLSSDKTQVVIPYKGWADPALISDLTGYDYSMDSGTTWTPMTPSSGTVLFHLAFTGSGASLTFTWEANINEGMDRYNNYIMIRLQATSGSHVTDYAYYTLYFERIQTNLSATAANIPFPPDYSGVSPSDLMKNAPRV